MQTNLKDTKILISDAYMIFDIMKVSVDFHTVFLTIRIETFFWMKRNC